MLLKRSEREVGRLTNSPPTHAATHPLPVCRVNATKQDAHAAGLALRPSLARTYASLPFDSALPGLPPPFPPDYHHMTARGAERCLERDSGYSLWDQSRRRAVGTKSSSLAGKRFQGRFYGRRTAVNAGSRDRSPTGRRRHVCLVFGECFFFLTSLPPPHQSFIGAIDTPRGFKP